MRQNYNDMENELRSFLHRILKNRTAGFLDYVDQMMTAPGTTLGEVDQLNKLKVRGKSMFMECQDELIMGFKCLLETGNIPEGIDKRATGKNQS